MQGHHRLAAPRTPLHHEHSGQRGAHDGILLSLHRCHDVVHATRAPGRECGHQHSAALHVVGPDACSALCQGFQVEHVVLEGGNFAALRHDVPTSNDAAGKCGCRLVERLGSRCPPVGEQWLLVVVGQPHAPDVSDGAVIEIKTAEAQASLRGGECFESLGVEADERLLLGHGSGSAGRLLALSATKILASALEQVIESGIEGGDAFTLGREFALAPRGRRSG